MALMKRGTSEEKEVQRLAKDAERATKDAEREAKDAQKGREREAKARDRMRRDFFGSPAGEARVAFERGSQVFQHSLDVLSTQTFCVPMMGAYSTPKNTSDPSDILNSVCNEGWELVNGSFVFLETGSESRDRFLRSGQQIAVSGTIVGYYVFKRCDGNKRQTTDPWTVPEAVESVASSPG